MKTKFLTKISTFIILMVMCITALVGCGVAWVGPKTNDDVTGNGGLAVQKGEYLYFVNGYTAIADMVDGDNKGGNAYSAIYCAKLTDGKLTYDTDGKLENCTKIIDKVCGYNRTSLYIFGDFIYYSTPNTNKTANSDSSSTTSNFELTDFYYAKLDGTAKTFIYKTDSTSDSTQFAFYKTKSSSDVNLAVFDGSKLVVINCSTKVSTTIAKSVDSVAMPKVTDYRATNNAITTQESCIYYTRSATDDETLASGNVIAYTKLGENTENIIASGTYTFAVVSANSDALIYTKKGTNDDNANNYYATFDDDGNLLLNKLSTANQLDYTGHTPVYTCDFENGICRGIIVKNSDNKLVWLDHANNNNPIVLNEDLDLTILNVTGTKIYCYDSANSLYVLDYKTKALTKLYDATALTEDADDAEDETVPDIYFTAVTNFSIAGDYLYFYIPYKGDTDTGYYLNRIDIYSATHTAELVGVVQDNHIVTEEE